MSIDQQAAAVLQSVRDFYKGELKSNNKRYDIDDIIAQAKASGTDPAAKAAAAQAANDRIAQIGNKLDALRNAGPGAGWKAYATKIYSQTGTGGIVGNCGEMAVLAAMFAEKLPVPGPIWIVSVMDNGAHQADHAFCLLGAAQQPTWTVLHDMDGQTSWVVDPWANIACAAKDYATTFVRKLAQWSDDGKKVWSHGELQTVIMAKYAEGFVNGKLGFSRYQ